ncbi:ATPase, AAA family [Ancylostoma ceylanicum]|uniref:ATPase, AAA family n=1 Tax=Ancylostoma ceylanicum TaxID=53326 RepID=A0A0D6M257_9BILA|nr:ATPase, AAA family [Ancylostoma ceylanicum]
MSMSDLYWLDEDLYTFLNSFSLAVEDAAKRGKNVTRTEVLELLSYLDTYKDRIEQSEYLQDHHVTSLRTTRELLQAVLDQDKSALTDSDPKAHGSNVKNEALNDPGNLPSSQNTSTGSASISPSLESNNSDHKKDEELDNFATSRRQAIESTILSNVEELPKFSDIAGLTEVFSSDLISTWSGQSEKLIRELFDHAIAQKKTAVIFIDEVDSLCRTRCASEDDANRRVKTELLVQIQRLQTTSNTVLVCATNCPWDLDPAFLRRFEKKIYVGLPDFEARLFMLNQRLLHTTLASDVSKEWIAQMTIGFSGDDIRRFASELAYTQFRYYKESSNRDTGNYIRQALSRTDIETVLAAFSKSVDDHHLARFEQFRNK